RAREELRDTGGLLEHYTLAVAGGSVMSGRVRDPPEGDRGTEPALPSTFGVPHRDRTIQHGRSRGTPGRRPSPAAIPGRRCCLRRSTGRGLPRRPTRARACPTSV